MASATRKKKRAAGDAYCPHCHLLIERKVGADWPEEPQRCPHCRLLVGAGRARPTPAAEPGAAEAQPGSSRTKRSGPGRRGGVPKEDVCQAIGDVADEVGARPERLLMVDYQQRASDDEEPARRSATSSPHTAAGSAPPAPPPPSRRARAHHRAPRQQAAGIVAPSMEVLIVFVAVRAGRHRGDIHRLLRRPERGARGLPHPRRPRLHDRDASLLYLALGRGGSGRRDRRTRRGRWAAPGPLRTEEPTATEELGKQLFIQNCKSCHTLAAVQAHGVTGPNLDELGGLDKQRVLQRDQDAAAPAPAACRPASSRARTPTPWPPTWPTVAGR